MREWVKIEGNHRNWRSLSLSEKLYSIEKKPKLPSKVTLLKIFKIKTFEITEKRLGKLEKVSKYFENVYKIKKINPNN